MRPGAHEARVLFFTSGWSWVGWAGVVTLRGTHRLYSGGIPAILPQELIRGLVRKLTAGRQYTTPPFAVPGSVVSAVVQIEPGSLSSVFFIDGEPAVVRGTRGTFQVVCAPAQQITPQGPVPDPLPTKSGRWIVRDGGQRRVLCE